jgi:hypothetical protein
VIKKPLSTKKRSTPSDPFRGHPKACSPTTGMIARARMPSSCGRYPRLPNLGIVQLCGADLNRPKG